MRQMRDDHGGAILDVDLQPLKERCPKWAMIGANICVQHAKGSKAVMDEAHRPKALAELAQVRPAGRD
jgi:uncharacterized protein (UPF0261 family)